MKYFVAIFFLGLLMAVHEGGHFLLARLYKMRVLKFSIGFGPVLWSKKPEGSDTTYQIALLPFLAYVQVAGMNPHEEIEEHDQGSYANASWMGRFLTIVAGPFANYAFAVVLFFLLLFIGGRPGPDGMKIGVVSPNSPAAVAQMQPLDEVRAVNATPVTDWRSLQKEIQSHKNVPIEVMVSRDGKPVVLHMTPRENGTIGVQQKQIVYPVGFKEAARDALIQPPKIAASFVATFGRLVTGREKLELGSAARIVEESGKQLDSGFRDFIEMQVMLSIYLCVFNLLPFPALDGGRLAFLLYEFVARKRPDAKVEARVHLVGMLALLTLMVPLFAYDIWHMMSRLFVKS